MKMLVACLAMLVLLSRLTGAQAPVGQKVGLVRYLQLAYAGTKNNLIAAAEKMPDGEYGFKPSQMSEARTFAAVMGHAADGMFQSCANAKRLPNPAASVEKTLSTKAEIVKALTDSIAFCDEAFANLTEESAAEYLRQGPVEVPRAAVLMGVLAHNAEMYGISTVYLRAKNLTPPASEPRR